MADNKKYYYLKLKENFFDTDEMIILESMQDGHLYSNILLKLYLRSLKNNGKLMFSDRIPYNSTALAQVTRHSVGVIEKALGIFSELELIEKLDNGAIYMTDIQTFIGESSTEGDRKRAHRHRIEQEKLEIGQMSGQMSDKRPPEIEIEIEIEKELELKDNTLERVLSYYETLQLPSIIKLSDTRKKNINARIKEHGFEKVMEVLNSWSQSDFLRGKSGEWAANIDWIFKASNFLKVLEGNYANKIKKDAFWDQAERMREW